MARQERQQECMERAYITLMAYVSFTARWVDAAVSGAGNELPQEEPPPLDPSAEALANLVTSGDVGTAVRLFGDAKDAFNLKWALFLNARGDPDEAKAAFEAVQVARDELERVGDDLMEKMREELETVGQLRSTPDGLGSGLEPPSTAVAS